MIFGAIPPINEILTTISELEEQLNRAS